MSAGLFLKSRLDRLRRVWYRIRFDLMESRGHQHVSIGPHTGFNVPVRANGRGTLIIGKDASFGFRPAMMLGSGQIMLQARRRDARVVIGDRTALSNNVCIVANEQIVIGDDCLIGDLVAIYDSDFHELSPSARRCGEGLTQPVRIGNNVWLGSRVMVLKGVSIGDNSVVAAASVVTKAIPANCIAAGAPAKVVRYFSAAELGESVQQVVCQTRLQESP